MKYLIVFSCLFLIVEYSFAQKKEDVLYHKSNGVIGTTETVLTPYSDNYILKRIYNGKLASMSVDTLYLTNDEYKGKQFTVSIDEKKFLLSHNDPKWSKRLRYKRFSIDDPFIQELESKSK